MEFHMHVGFWSILAESANVFSRNRKAMAFFSILFPTIYYLLYFSNIFSIRPLIRDLLIYQISFTISPGPVTPTTILKWTFLLLPTILATWFFVVATVLASVDAQELSLKELLLRTWRSSWRRPLATVSYIGLRLNLYMFLFSMLLTIPMIFLVLNTNVNLSATTLYAALAVVGVVVALVCAYMFVAWGLAFVVSIVEEKSGAEAVERGKEVVKGMELHGFGLNLVLFMAQLVVYLLARLVAIKDGSEASGVVVGLVVIGFLRLLNLFGWVAYTVLYCHCMKSKGESIEFSSIQYSKVATLP